MNRKTRLTALFLAAIMLLFAFTALSLIFHKNSHNCTDDCPVCAAISFCRDTLRTVCTLYLIFAAILCLAALSVLSASKQRTVLATPVLLKVKMTN